jgi:hypothetical protein
MLSILVDEAYAFDYLAILIVKNSEVTQLIRSNLQQQLPENLFNDIMSSDEFKGMIDANQHVFNCVERARYGSISAKELDDANMQRHYAKIKLQQRFFNTTLTEKKT